MDCDHSLALNRIIVLIFLWPLCTCWFVPWLGLILTVVIPEHFFNKIKLARRDLVVVIFSAVSTALV